MDVRLARTAEVAPILGHADAERGSVRGHTDCIASEVGDTMGGGSPA